MVNIVHSIKTFELFKSFTLSHLTFLYNLNYITLLKQIPPHFALKHLLHFLQEIHFLIQFIVLDDQLLSVVSMLSPID